MIIPQSPEELVSAWLAPLADIIRRLPHADRERADAALDFHAAAWLARDSLLTADSANAAVDRLITCLTAMLPDRERERFLAGRDLDGLAEVRAFVNAALADGWRLGPVDIQTEAKS